MNFKKINKRHYLVITLIAVIIVLGIYVINDTFMNIVESNQEKIRNESYTQGLTNGINLVINEIQTTSKIPVAVGNELQWIDIRTICNSARS